MIQDSHELKAKKQVISDYYNQCYLMSDNTNIWWNSPSLGINYSYRVPAVYKITEFLSF